MLAAGGPSSLSKILLSSVLLLGKLVSADCECGYSTSINGDGFAFTDLIESDFSRVQDISQDTDWIRQAFNVTKDRARGAFGEMFAVENIGTNANPGQTTMDEAGLHLLVESHTVEGMVPVAEIDTNRTDVYWGTFRASMKLTSTSGTCAAFFWVSMSSPS
jgi:hypothetical protein